jgi:hypothetical protein
MEFRQTQITELQKDIERTKKRNEETIKSITDDSKMEINDIISNNKNNQTQVNDMNLKQKAEFQLIWNKLGDMEKEIGKLERQI